MGRRAVSGCPAELKRWHGMARKGSSSPSSRPHPRDAACERIRDSPSRSEGEGHGEIPLLKKHSSWDLLVLPTPSNPWFLVWVLEGNPRILAKASHSIHTPRGFLWSPRRSARTGNGFSPLFLLSMRRRGGQMKGFTERRWAQSRMALFLPLSSFS